jgi:hypothetical protein
MEEIRTVVRTYLGEWRDWLTVAPEGFDFAALKPMHAGWKVSDEPALGQKIVALLPNTEAAHIGTVDKRKIALLVAKEPIEGVPVLQIMQLRPGSTDALGLDHVAFYCADMASLQLAVEKSHEKWEHQSNPGHQWISMWWGPSRREVKFFDHTSLDLGARELSNTSAKIKA